MNQRGFSLIFISIALLLVAGISGIAFYLGRSTVSTINQQFDTQQIKQKESTDLSTSAPTESQATTKIAYIRGEEVIVKILETNEELKTGIQIKGSEDVNPNATWCQGFDWSADGTKIFAEVNRASIFDLNTKKLTSLPGFQHEYIAYYQWDPLNKGLYYTPIDKKGVWFYEFISSKTTKISGHSLLGGNLNHPISPDGKKIILNKDIGVKDKFGNIKYTPIILNLDSSQETEVKLPENAALVRNPFVIDISWSPQSDVVAYVYETNFNDNKDAVFQTYRHIALFDLFTNEVKELNLYFDEIRSPVFSPNGKYLLYENVQNLWRSNADGTNSIKIMSNPVNFYIAPSWSPDSEKIVLHHYNEGVLIIDKDGKNKQIIDKEAECPIWSPQ